MRLLQQTIIVDNRDELIKDLEELQARGGIISLLGDLSYFFCFGLIFHMILKMIFNFYSPKRVPFDKWSIMDGISAFLNIAAV